MKPLRSLESSINILRSLLMPEFGNILNQMKIQDRLESHLLEISLASGVIESVIFAFYVL